MAAAPPPLPDWYQAHYDSETKRAAMVGPPSVPVGPTVVSFSGGGDGRPLTDAERGNTLAWAPPEGYVASDPWVSMGVCATCGAGTALLMDNKPTLSDKHAHCVHNSEHRQCWRRGVGAKLTLVCMDPTFGPPEELRVSILEAKPPTAETKKLPTALEVATAELFAKEAKQLAKWEELERQTLADLERLSLSDVPSGLPRPGKSLIVESDDEPEAGAPVERKHRTTTVPQREGKEEEASLVIPALVLPSPALLPSDYWAPPADDDDEPFRVDTSSDE